MGSVEAKAESTYDEQTIYSVSRKLNLFFTSIEVIWEWPDLCDLFIANCPASAHIKMIT